MGQNLLALLQPFKCWGLQMGETWYRGQKIFAFCHERVHASLITLIFNQSACVKAGSVTFSSGFGDDAVIL